MRITRQTVCNSPRSRESRLKILIANPPLECRLTVTKHGRPQPPNRERMGGLHLRPLTTRRPLPLGRPPAAERSLAAALDPAGSLLATCHSPLATAFVRPSLATAFVRPSLATRHLSLATV